MNDATPWGTTEDGREVHALTLRSEVLTASVLTYGATLERLSWRTGEGSSPAQCDEVDVVLGFPTMQGRLANPDPYLGAVVGPFANRIAGARMTVEGVEHVLVANDRTSCLHGGAAGTDTVVWRLVEHDDSHVVLTHRVEDGQGGFPGPIDITAAYHLDGATLDLELTATTARTSPVNLTHHAYFNLAGAGCIDDHTLRVPASHVLEVDELGIPVGARPVDAVGLDLRAGARLGDARRRDVPQVRLLGGLDHPFVVDGDGMRTVAELVHVPTGRRMRLASCRPSLQVYTGNALTTTSAGWTGQLILPGDGIALEPQGFPDSPNQAWMPSALLRPGQEHRTTMSWTFDHVHRPAPGSSARPPGAQIA